MRTIDVGPHRYLVTLGPGGSRQPEEDPEEPALEVRGGEGRLEGRAGEGMHTR